MRHTYTGELRSSRYNRNDPSFEWLLASQVTFMRFSHEPLHDNFRNNFWVDSLLFFCRFNFSDPTLIRLNERFFLIPLAASLTARFLENP